MNARALYQGGSATALVIHTCQLFRFNKNIYVLVCKMTLWRRYHFRQHAVEGSSSLILLLSGILNSPNSSQDL